jgi:hypothetical protein
MGRVLICIGAGYEPQSKQTAQASPARYEATAARTLSALTAPVSVLMS